MREFQFLLGRLETQTYELLQTLLPEFQFLLGRLETLISVMPPVEIKKFQFLLGRLETYMESSHIPPGNCVSIPLR